MMRIWRELPITDPLERRQTPLLGALLLFLFVTALLRLTLFFDLDTTAIGVARAAIISIISISSPALALLLLIRGRFSSAALLAALAMLLTIVLAIAGSGLRRSGMLPLVFALPIVLAGLLLRWQALALISALSCAAVAAIATLEQQRSPLVAHTPSPELPASMVSVFVFVVAILLFMLAWFRRDFHRELASRLQAEQVLRQSEARFSAAFRASPAAHMIVRFRDGAFVDVNASFERLLGFSRHEVIGQRADLIGMSIGPEQQREITARLQESGALPHTELQLRTKSGALHDVLLALELVELDGEPHILGIAVDITERKQAEHELLQTATSLRSSAARYAQLLTREQQARQTAEILHRAAQLLARSSSLDTILETLLDVLQQLIPCDSANIMLPDESGVYRVRYLRGYERWTDPSRVQALAFDPQQKPLIEEILRTGRSRLVADTSQEPAWTPMLGTNHIRCWLGVPLLARNQVVGIYSIDRRDPESITADHVQAAETLAGTAAAAIERERLFGELRDERALLARHVEERTAELRVANAELAYAARLKDEFLANMSHELRTPLASILGRAEALQESIYGPLAPKQADVLRGIEESGHHLLALINDVLDLAKIEAGQLALDRTRVDIGALCHSSMRLISQIAQSKGITTSLSIDSTLTTVDGDERRLKQILVNLLTNAVKFTPRGGSIGLEVRGDLQRRLATFTVWDTGVGIAPEDIPRLFQRFVQLDGGLARQQEGTGLGLVLVQRIAHEHGGAVAVTSAPGAGSRFSVTLPLAPA